MKTTLIVIQNEADHADAKKLIERLMGSSDSQDRARMVAQARLVEAYERAQWPRTAPALPVLLTYLMDQHGLSRADLVPLLGTASRVSEVLTENLQQTNQQPRESVHCSPPTEQVHSCLLLLALGWSKLRENWGLARPVVGGKYRTTNSSIGRLTEHRMVMPAAGATSVDFQLASTVTCR
jgi:HTH-type transcriptional regulator/antitoxin HigA